MDSKSRLDYALFQLTPTRTRCDLVICAGDCKEKLASGLLEPFIAHLKYAKDQISKGGYSITLSASASASWFTKSTIERFARFVSTPEVLERFITIEREIENIDCSINTNPSSDLQTVYGSDEHSNMATGSAYKHEGNTSGDVHEEDSKIQLQLVLETRKTVLQGEQAMVYARALVAGFETDNLQDLICFADAFGSPRLREACLNFMELCNTKSNDRVWMDEVASMHAYSHSQYSYMDDVQNGNFTTKKQNRSLDSTETDSRISHGSHLHQYMHTYQGNPLFQTPYYHGNLPWLPNAEASRRRGRRSLKKESRELTMDGDSDSSDSTSRKVVIRNINYITSLRDGKSEHESVDYISSNDVVNQDLDKTVEYKNEGQKVIQQWEIFQNLLMKDADDKDKLSDSQLKTQDILKVSESNRTQKKVEATCVNAPNDLYMVLGRDTAGQQAVPAWTPDMESGNSNVKIVKLDSVEVKNSRTKGLVEKYLERKGSKIEAKSKALVGSSKNSKSDIVSRIKKSTATKTPIRKGKSDKEEEKRKKTEELLTQRQKRIAERSAYTATSAKTDKPKSQLTSRDMKKSNPVTRVLNPRVRPTESKPSNKPIKVTTKQNFEPKSATKPIKVIRSSTIDRLSTARVLNPKVQPTESKPSNKPIKLTAKRNGEPNPATKPTKVTTKETGGSRTLLSKQTAGVEKKKVKPDKVKPLDKNNSLKNSNGLPINKIVDHTKVVSETVHKGSFNGSANKAINSVSFSFDKIINGVKQNPIAKTNHEIAPPAGKGSPEISSLRKKWSSLGGFRKLLSFGRRS